MVCGTCQRTKDRLASLKSFDEMLLSDYRDLVSAQGKQISELKSCLNSALRLVDLLQERQVLIDGEREIPWPTEKP